jgi:hypothetical protein
MTRVGEAVMPKEPDRTSYRRHYEVYQTLYADLRGAYGRIYRYQNSV